MVDLWALLHSPQVTLPAVHALLDVQAGGSAKSTGSTAPITPAPSHLAKPRQPAAKPQTLPDPSAAIGLAVSQINAGKLDEAEKLLSSIIRDSDKKAPNLGAHVARGTARALRRELEGASPRP